MATNPFHLMKQNFARPFFLPGEISQQPMNDVQKALITRLGVSMQQISSQMAVDQQVIFGRYELYTEEMRAIDHWMVGAAVKLYAEFVTNYSQMHDSTVWVTSDSPTYEKQIRKMFDTIGIEEKIFDWAYSIAAYGDLFIKVNAAPGVGIISVEDDEHPLNMSRVDIDGVLAGFYRTPLGYVTTGEGEGTLPILPPWEYIHFRLLGARKRRNLAGDPMANEFRSIHLLGGGTDRQITSKYGTALILDALTPYKRLRLAEDSVLLARLTRGILRYIYKIKVDSTNAEAVASLMDQYVAMLKHARAFDTSGSGFFDSKANPFCLRGDTRVWLCDGTSVSMKDLATNCDQYIGKYVESVNSKTLQMEPKKILQAHKTRENAQLVRVHLNNREHVDCTPDHRFMLRDGTFKEAQELVEGQILMPCYSKTGKQGLRYHKAVQVEFLNIREDTYDLEVEGNYTFALTAGVVVHNSGMEDILLPVWNDAGDITIEKVGGDPDIRWIVDVTELRNQLATALKCPLALLGAYIQEASGQLGDQAIEQLDIGFAKNSRRLQRTLIEGLTRMAQIHLAYMNLDPDPEMFALHMSQTSTAEEEQLKKALDTGMDVVQKLLDVLADVAPDLDKKKLFNYINQKILKLEGLDLAEFQKGLMEGKKMHQADIERIAGQLTKIIEARDSTRREILANSDLRSYLPVTEKCANFARHGLWRKEMWESKISKLVVGYGEKKKDKTMEVTS